MSNLTDAQLQELLKHIAERKPVTALLHERSPFGTVMMLAEEVCKWRRLYLDKPEDRLWHDSDKTWWTRQDDTYLGVGALYGAQPPPHIARMQELLEALLEVVDETDERTGEPSIGGDHTGAVNWLLEFADKVREVLKRE